MIAAALFVVHLESVGQRHGRCRLPVVFRYRLRLPLADPGHIGQTGGETQRDRIGGAPGTQLVSQCVGHRFGQPGHIDPKAGVAQELERHLRVGVLPSTRTEKGVSAVLGLQQIERCPEDPQRGTQPHGDAHPIPTEVLVIVALAESQDGAKHPQYRRRWRHRVTHRTHRRIGFLELPIVAGDVEDQGPHG